MTEDKNGNFWVFGYGSLMWRPGFSFLESRPARLAGLHRALCVYSWVHRGTEQRPGLVLGLDRGGACLGLGFKVCRTERSRVIDYLREREQVTNVYLEQWRRIRLDDKSDVMALTYVVDRNHAQYAGKLDVACQIELVSGARGKSGANPDYVISTAQRMQQLGIRDRQLFHISQQLQAAVR